MGQSSKPPEAATLGLEPEVTVPAVLRAEGWASQLGGTPSRPGRGGQGPMFLRKALLARKIILC